MVNLQEFHQDFIQSILSDADSRGLLRAKAFFENVCEELITTADLTNNYTEAEYTSRGINVYGYDYDEERRVLSLLSHEFFQEDEIQTLTKSKIDAKFKRLKKFYTSSINGLYKNMEESFDSYSMAYNIDSWRRTGKIDRVRLIIITDGKSTRTLKNIPSQKIDGMEIEFRIIDIEYLYKIYLSANSGGDFEVNLKLPCLKIKGASKEYKSYLSFLTGKELVEIYEQFGQRLFEQNVRTFLQFRGSVNKGLRNTIEYRPEMFFAYNNGITATASSVKFDESGNIIKIKNFQIVNGGQTTSAIYSASKNSKIDVSTVSVQMKLSVVKEKDRQSKFVSDVSEYANTQNKINKSDFFSNSAFHKEFKNYSNRVWVSAVAGSQRRTHWFYERVRGEYLNEQAYLTKAEKKQFQLENPKQQLLDKTFLAKSENTWLQQPTVVSKGAQFSFNYFATNITNQLEEDNLAITEVYFRDSISRVIMFKEVERLISKADWYQGGYRAQAVTYTIAYLSYIIQCQDKFLNFNLIWERQALPEKLFEVLAIIANRVYFEITNPPKEYRNVSEWSKKDACWSEIKKLNFGIEIDETLLIDKEEEKYNKKEEREEKKLVKDLEMQSFVMQQDMSIWKRVLDYHQKDELESTISPMQLDTLSKYILGYFKTPSAKQSRILYELYYEALSEGVIF